jgi:hypothetical protein
MNAVEETATLKPIIGKEGENNKKVLTNDYNYKKNSYHEVVKVLYLSEFQYVNNIKILIEKVKYPIQYSIKNKKPILLQKDLDLIFKGIPEIFQLSWSLCKAFKQALNTIEPNDFTSETIANIFLEYAKKFEVYIKYISYFSISSTAIKRLSSERTIFRNFLSSLKKKKALGKFEDIQNILELPIERIEKYINVLHIVQKISKDQQQQYNEIIDEALLFMEDLKDDLKNASDREKELQNLYTFKNSIENCPSSLVLSSRKLIKTFNNLIYVDTYTNMKIGIFTDLIVFARYNKKTNRYTFKKMVDYRILDIDEDSSSDYDSDLFHDTNTYPSTTISSSNNSESVITFYFQSLYRYSSRNDYSIVITNDYEDYSSIIENTADISFIKQLNSTPSITSSNYDRSSRMSSSRKNSSSTPLKYNHKKMSFSQMFNMPSQKSYMQLRCSSPSVKQEILSLIHKQKVELSPPPFEFLWPNPEKENYIYEGIRGLDDLIPVDDNSVILNSVIASSIYTAIPKRFQIKRSMTLLYSLRMHGSSLRTFYSRSVVGSSFQQPQVLLVRDDLDNVFGAFITEAFHPTNHFYGDGECFLWKVDTDQSTTYGSNIIKIFKWSEKNYLCIYSDNEHISLGAGDGHAGLYLDSNLNKGSSSPCDTYNNEALSSEKDFRIIDIELWAYTDMIERENIRRKTINRKSCFYNFR